ncbi:MAG: glycosyltransferase family 1 protein [Armatimonadia bacterium]
MRIAVDCRSVFEGCGGIGNYALHLVRALAAVNSRDEFVLLCSTLRPQTHVVQQANFRQVACPAAMIDAGWEQLQLPAMLTELGADLYHNPTFSVPIVAPCPTVSTIHDVVFHFRTELVEPHLCAYLQQWSLAATRTATRILTVSQYSKRAIMEAYGVHESRIDVTYEAADLARFRPSYVGPQEDELRAKHDIRGPFILYVGSLEPKKNLDRLLDAYQVAKRDACIPHSLVLAGGTGGRPYDAPAAIAERRLQNHVRVTGFLADDLLPCAYNAADLFVYPSLYEGFGLPPLEAMACGTPSIVSNGTSLPEVVGQAAWLVDPADTDALAAALVRLSTDRGAHDQLSRDGPQRARQFSWQRTALDTLACYRRAVGEHDVHTSC